MHFYTRIYKYNHNHNHHNNNNNNNRQYIVLAFVFGMDLVVRRKSL